MSKLRLILGIASLVTAGALVVLNLTLPPSSLYYDIGYGNMPWIPPVVFGIVGIVLLATAGIGRQAKPLRRSRPGPSWSRLPRRPP